MIFRNDEFSVFATTSANLNLNNRFESFEITESAELVDFWIKAFDELFDQSELIAPEKTTSELAKSYGTADFMDELFSNFKEVEAKQIKRSTLNEPETSHQIRKL
jgi:hypothetical protein